MKNKLLITIGALIGVVLIGFGFYQVNASKTDPKLSSEDIQQMVKAQYPGTITEVELEKKFNGYVYEVEIKDENKEYELKLDANTGEILKLSEKNIEKEHFVLEETNENNNNQTETNENSNDKQEKTTNNNKQQTEKNKDTKQNNDRKQTIDPKEAIDIALNEFSGIVKELEFEKDNGRLVYEIDIVSGLNEAEIKIDAVTGDIVKSKQKKNKKNKYGSETGISAKKAIDIALSKFSGTVVEIELDKDDGRLIYEVELKSGAEKAEIEIDAYTGEVLVIEIDSRK